MLLCITTIEQVLVPVYKVLPQVLFAPSLLLQLVTYTNHHYYRAGPRPHLENVVLTTHGVCDLVSVVRVCDLFL